jgi:hypothetical protein
MVDLRSIVDMKMLRNLALYRADSRRYIYDKEAGLSTVDCKG